MLAPGVVVDLVLDGVDTVAMVTLNSGTSAECASAHAPCVLRGVQAALRFGGGRLAEQGHLDALGHGADVGDEGSDDVP